MSDGRNKYQSRENRGRVREMFWQDWDPIGVQHVSNARDEYDRYADMAYVMLMDQAATAAQIADYLIRSITDRMGLPLTDDHVQRSNSVAAALVKCRPEFETH